MDEKEILKSYLKIADIQASRMQLGLNGIAHKRPLSEHDIDTLSTTDSGNLELATGRFAKLQDLISAKIFPLTLVIFGETLSELTFIDRLNKLEKFGFLDDAQEWIEMKKARNHVIHEYPENPEQTAFCLNNILDHADNLLTFWGTFKQQLQSKIKING